MTKIRTAAVNSLPLAFATAVGVVTMAELSSLPSRALINLFKPLPTRTKMDSQAGRIKNIGTQVIRTIADLNPNEVKVEIEKIIRSEDRTFSPAAHFDTTKPTDREKELEKLIADAVKEGKYISLLDRYISQYRIYEQSYLSRATQYSINTAREQLDRLLDQARQSRDAMKMFTDIKTAANGNNERALELLQEKLKNPPSPKTSYFLEAIMKDDSYERMLEPHQEALMQERIRRQDLSVAAILESRGNIWGFDDKLLIDRALVNLTNDPQFILPYFPTLKGKLAEGKLSNDTVLVQLRELASLIQGGYIGKGINISAEQADILQGSPFDLSTKFMIAAAWLATRPGDQYAMDWSKELKSFPKEVCSVNGSYNKKINDEDKLGDALGGHNGENRTVIQIFSEEDDIEVIMHEFAHQRDRKSGDGAGVDGYMHNTNEMPGLLQYFYMLGAKLESDTISSKEIFKREKTVVNNNPKELIAYATTAFLMGNEKFRTHALELKLPQYKLNFYDCLVQYYGVDPLKKPAQKDLSKVNKKRTKHVPVMSWHEKLHEAHRRKSSRSLI